MKTAVLFLVALAFVAFGPVMAQASADTVMMKQCDAYGNCYWVAVEVPTAQVAAKVESKVAAKVETVAQVAQVQSTVQVAGNRRTPLRSIVRGVAKLVFGGRCRCS